MNTMKGLKVIGAFILSLLFMPLFQSPLMGRDEPPNNPEITARELLSAYKSCNRARALKFASPAAVKKLFKNCQKGGVDIDFAGCEKSGKAYSCSYHYEGGGVNMRVVKYRSGYRIVKVSFIAD